MKIIATKPVSIFWQIVFVFVIDVFAFYRIKKLKRYLLIVVLPAVLLSTTFSTILFQVDLECESDWLLYLIYDTCQELNVQIGSGLIK